MGRAKTGQNRPRNANDHEQRARVHPALPSYSVVVPAPELLSIDVAVADDIGAIGAFRKGALIRISNSQGASVIARSTCDEAIQFFACGLWIASLSSGGASRRTDWLAMTVKGVTRE